MGRPPKSAIPPERRTDLSEREQEVCAVLAESGDPNFYIAQRMAISEETVKRHLTTICDKLGLDNRTQVALWWIRTHEQSTQRFLEAENARLRRQRDNWKGWFAL